MKIPSLPLVALLVGIAIAAPSGSATDELPGHVIVILVFPDPRVDQGTIGRELLAALRRSGRSLTQAQIDATSRDIARRLAEAGNAAEGRVQIDAWGLKVCVSWGDSTC